MKNKGQNLVEICIIFGCIIVVSILALTLLGHNVFSMFDNSANKYLKFKAFPEQSVIASSSNPGSEPLTPDPIVPGVPSTTTEVTFNPDGSASLSVSGQNISLSSSVIADLNEVFEGSIIQTAGSSGMPAEIMAAMQKLIDDHKDEYTGNVPIEMVFGTGTRHYNGTYEGNATYNQVALSVGEHKIFVQNDQTFSGSATEDLMGVQTVEVIGDHGTVTSSSDPALKGLTLTFGDYQNSTFDDGNGGWTFQPTSGTTSI